MTWTAKYERTFKFSISLWRSDKGVWGYYHDMYDGYQFYCFGLGKLLHICWGDSVE